MGNGRGKASHRVLAAFLSLVMAISAFPLSTVASAATTGHPDAVTITVTDQEKKAVADASVAITVHSASQGTDIVQETKTTDKDGVVEVLPSASFVADDLTLSAVVTAKDYEKYTLPDTAITDAKQNFPVALADRPLKDVQIKGKTLTYTGEPQALVAVKARKHDTITYTVDDGRPHTKVPTATDVCSHKISVTVKRAGEGTYTEEVIGQILPASITNISIAARHVTYNEKEQALVKLHGRFEQDDVVTWTVNGEETTSRRPPKATMVGTYTVSLTVNRGPNYHPLTLGPVTAEIQAGTMVPEGITAQGLEGVYTVENGVAKAQETVRVDNPKGYKLQYQLDDGDGKPSESAWVDTIPTVTDAGSYLVWVRALKEGYQAAEVSVIPAAKAQPPYNVYVEKAPCDIAFTNSHYTADGHSTFGVETAFPSSQTFDFSAETSSKGGKVHYSIIEDENFKGMAQINAATGQLTVSAPGVVTVVASFDGDTNYESCRVQHTLEVYWENFSQSDMVAFQNPTVAPYTVNGNSPAVVTNTAAPSYPIDPGKLTYRIQSDENLGLSVDDHGAVTVSDYGALLTAVGKAQNDGGLTVTVQVDKAAWGWLPISHHYMFPAGTATYSFKISAIPAPAASVTFSEPDGKNGWYNQPMTVTAPEGFTIAKVAENTDMHFAATVSFDDPGTADRYICLQDVTTGNITAPLPITGKKIDNDAPTNLQIAYSETSLLQKIGEKLGFYKPDVSVTLTATDTASGVEYFTWSYTREEKASGVNVEKIVDQTVRAENHNGVATAVIQLPRETAQQYRGKISFTATDVAGKTSPNTGNDYVFVIDGIRPTSELTLDGVKGYGAASHTVGTTHYYQHAVDAKLTICEANFYPEDVQFTVFKDGKKVRNLPITWTDVDADIHEGAFTLEEDGAYVIRASYQDKSFNHMDEFRSETVVVDTHAPVLQLTYDHKGDEQKTTFRITERNFDPSGVVVSGTMKDLNGNDIDFTPQQLTELLRKQEWTKDGDTYTFTYSGYPDGIYNLTFHYQDAAGWDAKPDTAPQFVIDRHGPEGLTIEYATSPKEAFLEKITLGFYNPTVYVRLTAYDLCAGVESFTWEYTKEEGASEIRHPDSLPKKTVPAVPDETDRTKFTAEFPLTADKLAQYRGYLTVSAVDKFQNRSAEKVDKDNIVVVDTVNPTMTPTYTKADRFVPETKTHYYNNAIDIELTMTEANFYPEDVQVTVTRDGAPFDVGAIQWGNRNQKDETVGRFTLPAPADHSGDGRYQVHVNYEDRSHNPMTAYVSDTLVIDTTRPTVHVNYQNKDVANVLQDWEKHSRRYFDNTQTAEIVIDEANFNPADVDFRIEATDVSGHALPADGLYRKSAWTQGQTPNLHVMTITYPGDANYTFDVDYTDLATNPARDYAPDYFTVDKTAPVVLPVHYSDSVLNTKIGGTDFRFYHDKVKVTIAAEDAISGVHSFLYSYVTAAGVSPVNAGLINQAIEAGKITYSEDGKRATATFEIPREALSAHRQFNGTVECTAIDRAAKKAALHKETTRIVADNIAPTREVTFNQPANVVGGTSYYAGDIHATVTINEANFYAGDVQVLVSRDKGPATAVTPRWTNNGGDRHTGTFTLHGDGDYLVTVRYTDKSGNPMKPYTSGQMTIDTQIKEPTYSINGTQRTDVGGAYKGDVNVGFHFQDQNFATAEIRLSRTRFNAVEDVTSKFIRTAQNAKGGSGSFKIPAEVENDGIYVLRIAMTDKAKHTAESQIKFTVNRFGSVYEYNDALLALIHDGGQHVVSVDEDLVITEYNASRLLRDSLSLLITRDGKPIDVKFTSNPAAINEQVGIGESGWYQYVYRIKASNFAKDGVYKISLTSQYASDDAGASGSASVPENSIGKDGKQVLDSMTFTVDSTAPEIRNIVHLDKPIVNAQNLNVKYTLVDVGGLASVTVLVNGEPVSTITDFGDHPFRYSGRFTLHEQNGVQTVQLKVRDLAGNVTDTASDAFQPGDLYVFNDHITVSTNVFVRWFANKPLFWGTIGGVVVLVGGLWLLIAAKRKKKEDENA